MYSSTHTNKELLDLMDVKVYGHQGAKKVLINAINRSKIRWHQEFSLGMKGEQLINNKNVLLIGASGSGKTLLIETLCEICDVPFLRFDATQIKPSGAGDGLTIKQMIKDIEQHSAWLSNLSSGKYSATEIMKQTIIFIDEVDKLAMRHDSSGNWNKNVQANLLQLVTGKTEVQGVTFIFAGAFSEMLEAHNITKKTIGFHKSTEGESEKDWDEAIVKAGIIPELAGRIHSVVKLDVLKHIDYEKILDAHILPLIYKQLEYYDCFDFFLTAMERERIIQKALNNDQGVRMLTKEVQKLVEEYEFNFEDRRDELLLTYMLDIEKDETL